MKNVVEAIFCLCGVLFALGLILGLWLFFKVCIFFFFTLWFPTWVGVVIVVITSIAIIGVIYFKIEDEKC